MAGVQDMMANMSMGEKKGPAGSAPRASYVPPHMRNAQAMGGKGGNGDPNWAAAPSGRPAPSGPYGARAGPRGDDAAWSSFNGGGDSRNDSRSSYGSGGGFGGGPRGGPRGGRMGANDGYGAWVDGQHKPAPPNPRLEVELFGGPKLDSGINFADYDNIPVEVSGADIEPIRAFENPPIDLILLENIKLAGYAVPTPVQKYSVPIVTSNRDLMACAQTGSGKTAGFLFPILSQAFQNGPSPPTESQLRVANYTGRSSKVFPTTLILAPTRELVSQIFAEAKKFCYRSWVRPAVCYGGAEMGSQIREIEKGCDLLAATPGRLVDLIDRGKISLEKIRYLILDEADRMLDMGFEPQIRRIIEGQDFEGKSMPDKFNRQTMMFSATFPHDIQTLAGSFLNNYIFLSVGRVGSASENIKQELIFEEDEYKKREILQDLISTRDSPTDLIIVFVEQKAKADMLCNFLIARGLPATAIHGDMQQRDREYSLSKFKKAQCPILVATAVASRGLDIPNVKIVVQYDVPKEIDEYVHRIGRTGRAGNVGRAMAFVGPSCNLNFLRGLEANLQEAKQEIPMQLSELINSMNRFGGGGRGGRGGGRGGRGGARGGRPGAMDSRRGGGGGGGGGGFGGSSQGYGGGFDGGMYSQSQGGGGGGGTWW